MIKNLSLFYNKEKEPAKKIARIVEDIAKSEKLKLIIGNITNKTELIISVGGDGTVLKTSRYAIEYNVPIAHINIGTLGFLGIETKDVSKYIMSLIKNNYKIEERVMLRASIGTDKKPEKFIALNDIVIKNGDIARVINLELYLEDKKVYTIKGDGMIISTPTGSTAYSLAVGGPVVMPNLSLMIVTPLNPHSLTTRPVIVEDIPVKIICPKAGEEIILTADGQVSKKLVPPVQVQIGIYNKKLKLVKSDEKFFDLLSRKMNWG